MERVARPDSGGPIPAGHGLSGLGPGAISGYPGHIAKAERQLHQELAKVGPVIEVDVDARIPRTGHPACSVDAGPNSGCLVINRRDMVNETAGSPGTVLGAARARPLGGDARAAPREATAGGSRAGWPAAQCPPGRSRACLPRPCAGPDAGVPKLVGKSDPDHRTVVRRSGGSARRGRA